MEKKLNVSINIESTSISHFSSFTLEQKFNEHHKFELRFNHDQVESQGMISLTNSKNFIGKNITVEFGADAGSEQIFVGKVTRVEFSQSHGYQGDLIVSGFSPTILLERGPDLGSYLAKDLKTIVEKATSDAPSNDLKMKVKPARTGEIDYIIQYRESDFEFLNRLSAEYHEWFFYDGTNLIFGKPDKLKEVPLVYGRNLQNLQYALQIAPLKYTKFAYSPGKDQILTSDGKGTPAGTADMSHAISSSNQVYDKGYNQPVPIRVDSKKEIDDYVQNEQKAIISDLVRVTGSGDEPMVSIGGVVDISMSMREMLDFTVQDFGKFLVTSVFHHIDGLGHYYNTFEAVAADTERLPVYGAQKPMPDIQLATVLDNDDPDKQSRIKVKFKWNTANNDPTEWLRIITPSAGSDDQGGSNRGFITIPEKNDQVLIAFEEGNIARPVVMGSVYHSSNGHSKKQQSNHIKSMSTRSGHLIEFDDSSATQGIKITDRNSNIIHIDTHGNNITITAGENMTLNAKNMQINVQENFDINVQKDMTVSVEENSIAMKAGKKVTVKAMDIELEGSNSIAANGKASVKIESAQVEVTGSTHAKVTGGTLDLEGTGMANVKAPLVKIN
jgi:type VI secretion system secreted protein VgrG